MLKFRQFLEESEVHPKLGEYGDKVVIRNPSTPTPMENWSNPKTKATTVPNGQFPSELTQEELKQKEDLYSSKIENELNIDHVKTYIHSEAWR